MDFSFTEEQELFRKSVREFCEKRLPRKLMKLMRKERFPEKSWKIWHLLAFLA